MNKQNVSHAYKGILLNLEREWNPDTRYIQKNLKDMTPNEINQTPKDKYGVISHTGSAKVIQVHGEVK